MTRGPTRRTERNARGLQVLMTVEPLPWACNPTRKRNVSVKFLRHLDNIHILRTTIDVMGQFRYILESEIGRSPSLFSALRCAMALCRLQGEYITLPWSRAIVIILYVGLKACNNYNTYKFTPTPVYQTTDPISIQ